jgi:broad specificity phosphatase PhoE
MEKVILIRHSMPIAHNNYRLYRFFNGQGIVQFVKDWNDSGVVASFPVSKQLQDEIKGTDHFICSTLKRTIDSFSQIGVENPDKLALFNEAELPVLAHYKILLPFVVWGILLRILWRFGILHSSESYKNFKKRMIHACDYINNEQENCKNIALMGHGLVNRELRKLLTKRGFVCVRKFKVNSYFGFAVLEKNI